MNERKEGTDEQGRFVFTDAHKCENCGHPPADHTTDDMLCPKYDGYRNVRVGPAIERTHTAIMGGNPDCEHISYTAVVNHGGSSARYTCSACGATWVDAVPRIEPVHTGMSELQGDQWDEMVKLGWKRMPDGKGVYHDLDLKFGHHASPIRVTEEGGLGGSNSFNRPCLNDDGELTRLRAVEAKARKWAVHWDACNEIERDQGESVWACKNHELLEALRAELEGK